MEEVHKPVKEVVLDLVQEVEVVPAEVVPVAKEVPVNEESHEEDEDHPKTDGHDVNLKDELAELENGDNSYVAEDHHHNEDAE